MEHLQIYHRKWLCNVNEKVSLSQAITKVKGLERKFHNPERSAAAPAALQRQIPAIPHELSGHTLQPASVFMSQCHPVIFDDNDGMPSSSSQNIQNSSVSAVLPTSHSSDPGSLVPLPQEAQRRCFSWQ